ncbi:Smr/MutS family protein [Brevundimonas sp. NIBR11]|uniref:Smr/MutS family protein n=1 Tax=Brevundimonas sp. NIBR11 TaxID=3015999 RepID=UPI0022F09C54|nr:Smr/MutS family protein [Brevundimonas sp. NIBR11]WGM32554.1 Endonuclease MutS2 [Brevundimonas sp. NIBR11]
MARRPPPDLTAEDRRIWARVSGSVTPPKTRKAARIIPGAILPDEPLKPETIKAPRPPVLGKPKPSTKIRNAALAAPAKPTPVAPRSAPEELEPRRQRRLSRERDPIEASIDLHGFGRFEAEDQLRAFLMQSHARGLRAVLVVTGQGRRGGGIIRASIHEWLQGHALRGVVSGFAMAHRRHGGDGAIYVTLKR